MEILRQVTHRILAAKPPSSFRRTNVTPAKAGAESMVEGKWIPAFAGMTRIAFCAIVAAFLALTTACSSPDASPASSASDSVMTARINRYATVTLSADLSALSENERKMLPLLVDAAKAMDEIFKQQAYGNLDSLLKSLSSPAARRFVEINYGPWDRLDNNTPFIPGVGVKPAGANFYPAYMEKAEFESAAGAASDSPLRNMYTIVRRDANRKLVATPFHEAYAPQVKLAAAKLREAAALAPAGGLKRYLELRADALLSDNYKESDMAWMDMKDNTIEVVIGPIENYEDGLFGLKAANEAFVLIKDQEWSKRLSKYASMLPALQRGLPVPDKYKAETPGTSSDLNAYDAIYYAGDANAGAKTIAINLPNDEEVQLKKGTRRLQLKNSMRAKFDKILVPIAGELIAEDQRKHITFDAFFSNTMFHEVAHGLGIKQTLNGRGLVRESLKEQYSALEEGKADILGLYMETRLHEQGELGGGADALMDAYVTFVASIFRSVRFGAASAHGRANIARFNFFSAQGAFIRDAATGTYRVDAAKMKTAMNALSEQILRFQGDGDYDGVVKFMQEKGNIGAELQGDLDRLGTRGIPVDIVFEYPPAAGGK